MDPGARLYLGVEGEPPLLVLSWSLIFLPGKKFAPAGSGLTLNEDKYWGNVVTELL